LIGGTQIMGELLRDLRYGFRMIARRPGFAIIVTITLAVGIGVNTAIFSMVNGILLRALPYPQPGQLYGINEVVPQFSLSYPSLPVTGGNFLMWQRGCPAFSAMAILYANSGNLLGPRPARFLEGAEVTADFFPLLGVRPQMGRGFLPEENQRGRAGEIVLTYQLWQREFNSDPHIIGRSINLGGHLLTVVGVLPADFRFPEILPVTPQYLVPFMWTEENSEPGIEGHNYAVLARLRTGVSARQALSQLNTIEAQIAAKSSGGKFGLYATLTPLKSLIVGSAQRVLAMLFVAAGLVLLIICINLASLMFVRNAGRTHEIALRLAVGATARRIIRQLLTEAGFVGATSGVLGFVLAYWGLQLLVFSAPVDIPRRDQVGIDPGVLLFTVGVSFVSAMLFAFIPTLYLAKVEPMETLKSEGPTVSGSKRVTQLQGWLVMSELALSGILLSGALLLIQSLSHVVEANHWMDEDRVLTIDLIPPVRPSEKFDQRERFFSTVQEKVEELPEVQSAGFVSALPLKGASFGDPLVFQEVPRSESESHVGEFRFVSPGYFQAIGMPLMKGRLFSQDDRSKDVAIISESVAKRELSARDPLGMHVRGQEGKEAWCQVIGVVDDVRTASDEPPILAVYFPLWEYTPLSETLVVRARTDTRPVATAIQHSIWQIDPEVAMPRVQTLGVIVQTSIALRRYETFLSTIFAIFAVLLASLGLYGVISYTMSQRVHEIAIRMALGARQRDIMMMVISNGLRVVLAGAFAAIVGALMLTRFLSSLLYGVKADDLRTLALVAVGLTVVALMACYIPARRATKVDPATALRYQ
jgi:putative ABC transport system permease protein